MHIISIIAVTQILALRRTYGYYVKPKTEESKHPDHQWNFYQKKLGLSFGRDNLKYVVNNAEKGNLQEYNDMYFNKYRSLIENMKLSKRLLKTSLNELNGDDEKSTKDFKRLRRKLAVRIVSDMPIERIDELLKLFNHQHGIDHSDSNKTHDVLETNYDDIVNDSNQTSMPLTATNTDYIYENLYEDDQDATVSSKINSNGEFKSFQDFIMQATETQWN